MSLTSPNADAARTAPRPAAVDALDLAGPAELLGALAHGRDAHARRGSRSGAHARRPRSRARGAVQRRVHDARARPRVARRSSSPRARSGRRRPRPRPGRPSRSSGASTSSWMSADAQSSACSRSGPDEAELVERRRAQGVYEPANVRDRALDLGARIVRSADGAVDPMRAGSRRPRSSALRPRAPGPSPSWRSRRRRLALLLRAATRRSRARWSSAASGTNASCSRPRNPPRRRLRRLRT